MRRLVWRALIAGIVLCSLLAGGGALRESGVRLMRADDPAPPPRSPQLAQRSYRIAVRIEALGRVCIQDLEVRSGWVRRVRQNTCENDWVGLLTIERLTDLASEIESIPAARCPPTGLPCPCHRVFTRRDVAYHPLYGFPTAVISRSELRPNLAGSDYWRETAERHALPDCPASGRRFTLQVLSFAPLEPDVRS